MKTYKEFIAEAGAKVKVGDEVEVHYKKMNGDTVSRGVHKVTKVGANHFEIDREGEDGKPMKFKHNGYGRDYAKASSGKIKGLSKTYGHFIKSLTEEVISESTPLERANAALLTGDHQAALQHLTQHIPGKNKRKDAEVAKLAHSIRSNLTKEKK